MSILEEIEATTSAPSNEELATLAELAQQQLDILGVGTKGPLTKGPSSSAIGDLLDWGKTQGVAPVESGLGLSIADLVGCLGARLGEYRRLSEKAIPEAMAGLNMSMYRLATGFTVEVADDVNASILSGQEKAAARWLDSQGLGDVVKDEVKVTLGRGEAKLAKEFLDLAEKLGVEATEKESVHFMTLKALVKEQLAIGVEFPSDCFSVFPFKKAVVKPPSDKKPRSSRTAVRPQVINEPFIPLASPSDFNEF